MSDVLKRTRKKNYDFVLSKFLVIEVIFQVGRQFLNVKAAILVLRSSTRDSDIKNYFQK